MYIDASRFRNGTTGSQAHTQHTYVSEKLTIYVYARTCVCVCCVCTYDVEKYFDIKAIRYRSKHTICIRTAVN